MFLTIDLLNKYLLNIDCVPSDNASCRNKTLSPNSRSSWSWCQAKKSTAETMLWEMETGAGALNLDGRSEVLPGRGDSKPSTAGGDKKKSHLRLCEQLMQRS